MQNSRAESLVRYANRYGFWNAINLFLQMTSVKAGFSNTIRLSGFPSLHIRKNSTDLATLRQIFMDEEYRFNLFNPKVIVDLGANVGFATVYFSKFFPDAKFIAVEPDEQNFKQLLKNTSKIKNITCLNKAVWTSECVLFLEKSGELGEWGVQTLEQKTEFPVETITIEQIMKQFDLEFIDVLKIDIETAEEEIFKEAKWLERVKIAIVETHDRIKASSSNNFIRALANLDKFNIHLSGENFVIYNTPLIEN